MSTKATVRSYCPEQIEYCAKVELPYALMGGTLGMQAAGRVYLPQWPMEHDDAYAARLAQSVLYPGFERAITSNTGRVFRSPLKLQKAPAAVQAWAKRVDKQGRDLNTFARDFFSDALVGGIAHVLTDHPPVLPKGATMEDKRAAKHQPFLCHIQHRNVLDWDEVDGELTMFRYLSWARRRNPENRFEVVFVEQVREWTASEITIFEAGGAKGDDWGNPTAVRTPNTFGKIPLSTLYLARKGFMEAEPVFDECAYLNVAHWQSYSDQRNILHVARVPFLFGNGFKKGEKVVVGSQTMVTAENPDADVNWKEVTGGSIEQGKADCETLKEDMRLAGLEPMQPASGDITATGRALDYSEANSALQAMGIALVGCITDSATNAGTWLGEKGESSIEAHQEFGFGARDSADVQALISMRTAPEPQISRSRFWLEMKRRNVLSHDFDPKVEEMALEAERQESVDLREEEHDLSADRSVDTAERMAKIAPEKKEAA